MQLNLFQTPERQLQMARQEPCQQAPAFTVAEPLTYDELLQAKLRLKAKYMDLERYPESEHAKQTPRDQYVILAEINSVEIMAGKRKRKAIRLGPFHSTSIMSMGRTDREQVLDAIIAHPTYGYYIDVFANAERDQPKRKLSKAQRLLMSKRNAMKRVIKRYGMLADQFIAREYQAKGWQ